MTSDELINKLEEIRDCINSDGTAEMIEFYIDDLYGSEISNTSGIKYRMDETIHYINMLQQHLRSYKQMMPKIDSILHQLGIMNKPVFISVEGKSDADTLHKKIDSSADSFSITVLSSISDSGEKQERISRILKFNPDSEKFHLSDFSDFLYVPKDF